MKKITTIIIFLLTLVLFSVIVQSADSSTNIDATILRYEPDPAEQGTTFDVWVQLSNHRTKLDEVSIKFIPEYPFATSSDDEESDEMYLGSIAAIEDKVVKFTVYVDPNAPNGIRNIKFGYRHSGSDEWIILESPIQIQTQDSVLVIDEYKVSPNPVIPGQVVDVSITLRNAGRIAVKNIDVDLGVAENHFSSIGSGTKKRIPYIQSGETATVNFQLASDTNTEIKIYSVPITLTYSDEKNKEYTSDAKISLMVNAEPEISVLVEETKFQSKKSPGTVSVKIINKGIVDLKYLTAKILPSADYEIMSSSNEEYVGNLDSDDFETVDFIIRPKKSDAKINLELTFKDPYNKNFVQNYEIPLKIVTQKDLGKSGSPVLTIIIIILIVGAGYFWWRRRKNKHKKQNRD